MQRLFSRSNVVARSTRQHAHAHMETDNKENICRDVLDKLGDAAQNNAIPEHLFISIADDLKRIVAARRPVTVPWPCFSIHDGPLVDTNINVSNVGVVSNALQPHCPRLIKTQEWYMQTKTWSARYAPRRPISYTRTNE